MNITIEQLAVRLYEADTDGMQDLTLWNRLFTKDELIQLWDGCKITKDNPFGRAYDDEVYEALQKLEYFK